MSVKVGVFLCLLLITTVVYGFRINKPFFLRHPLTEDQVISLNNTLEDLWNMQKGRYELDIVTTSKTNAKNGEMWIIFTSPVARIQYKSNDIIWTITPDGI